MDSPCSLGIFVRLHACRSRLICDRFKLHYTAESTHLQAGTSDKILILDFGRQRTEDRGQMTEDRGQMTEDRWQMTEGRGQMTEDPSSLSELRRGTQRTESI